MARLDWFSFLRQHNIPYTTVGPNASRGRVNIRCPWCGQSDPSEHMGINLDGRGYACWRNQGHRGRDQARLIAQLLQCGLDEARRLLGGDAAVPTDAELMASMREKLGMVSDTPTRPTSITLNREFNPLDDGSPFAEQFLDYLRDRGYTGNQLTWLIKTYDLHYATRGKFAYRVIIPVYDRWNELLTWTGRSILADEELRYKALRKELQVCAPKQTLLGLSLLWNCSNPKVLVLVEGPFDAWRITSVGRSLGVYATCLFGLSIQPEQVELLLDLRSRFKQQVVLLDEDARFQAFRMANSGLRLGLERLPDGVKDAGELSSNQAVDICLEVLNKATSPV